MMVKKGTVPHYELIHDGGGTHENTFTYQVSCQGLYANGTGRCKKDAKHLAAMNMLETIAAENNYLALPPIPGESPVRTMPTPHILSADEPFVNAIGELQDLCAEAGLPDPIYETVGDEGPAHAKIFTIHSKIYTITEEGRSTTKKHAKHLAARKMGDRIKNLIDNAVSTYDLVKNELEKNNSSSDDNFASTVDIIDAIEPIDFSKLSLHYKTSLGVKLSEFHTKLKTTFDDDELRETIVNELNKFAEEYLGTDDHNDLGYDSYYNQLRIKFNNIISTLNISAVISSIPTIDPSSECISIILDSVPVIVECAIGKSRDKNLLKSLFTRIVKTLSLLLT
ncbi:uncharacterized protein LOC103577876 isoform X2 [Microplitis demolitor]|nr:uncharacterized protein LOC103577876 isoform X2 [Microplitis demolitor]